MAIPCCFSRSRCNWLDKLRASKGFPLEPEIQDIVSSSSLSLQGNPSSSSGITVSSTGNACIAVKDSSSLQQAEERKQERASEPDSPAAEQPQSTDCSDPADRASSGCRKISSNSSGSGSGSGNWTSAERYSPVCAFGLPPEDFEQSPTVPSAQMVVKLQRKRKQERPRSFPSPPEDPATTWKTCMEKMQAFSLRSDSSTESEMCRSDDSSLDSSRSRRKGKRMSLGRRRSSMTQPDQSDSKRRKKLVDDEGQAAKLQSQRRVFHQSNGNGFIDFHSSVMRGSQGFKLPIDHPACQPKDTLVYSTYKVFMKAGKTGLTAREAVSKILDEGLPGLGECGVVARVEVGKIVRASPYFMQLEESKFVLCSAITGNEDKMNSSSSPVVVKSGLVAAATTTTTTTDQCEIQNWARVGVRRARTGKTRRKAAASLAGFGKSISSDKTRNCNNNNNSLQQQQLQQQSQQQQPRKRRLKSVQQDRTGLGNRCNRSDGKGWHCPLLAQVGYLLCDHHLDRLRSKSGSKARRPNRRRAERRRQIQQQQAAEKQQAAENDGESGGGGGGKASANAKFVKPTTTTAAAAATMGIRQSLSVARGGRSGRRQVQQQQKSPEEEQVTESGEVITTFGL